MAAHWALSLNLDGCWNSRWSKLTVTFNGTVLKVLSHSYEGGGMAGSYQSIYLDKGPRLCIISSHEKQSLRWYSTVWYSWYQYYRLVRLNWINHRYVLHFVSSRRSYSRYWHDEWLFHCDCVVYPLQWIRSHELRFKVWKFTVLQNVDCAIEL